MIIHTFYHPSLERLPREELKALQLKRLKEFLQGLYHNNAFYQKRFKENKVNPEKIYSLQDFSLIIPPLTKQDLLKDQQENPPYGSRLGVSPEEIKQVHLTSGTTGIGQEVYGLTEKGMEMEGNCWLPHYISVGLKEGDVCAVLWPIATMAASLSAYEGLRQLKTNPFLLALYDGQMKLKFMKTFSPHYILTVPAYLTRLGILCEEMGIVPKKDFSRLKGITVATEPYPINWALEMEAFWGCAIHEMYGSTQQSSLLAGTCERGAIPNGKRGALHFLEYLTYVEVVDPQTGKPVKYGEEGEAIITTFSRDSSPLVRFKTDDRVKLFPYSECPCGRTLDFWEAGTISRYDDMIKIKAANVWPQTVDEIVFSCKETDEYNAKVYIDDDGREQVDITLEFKKSVPSEQKIRIIKEISQDIKRRTQVTMRVMEAIPGTIERFEFKARRWTDERRKGLEKVKYKEK